MHIGQLEDRILEARPRAIQRSTPRLAGQHKSKDPADARRPAKAANGTTCSKMLLSQRGLGHPNAEPVRNRP